MNLALDWFLVGAACGSLLTLVATLVGRRSRNRKNARTRVRRSRKPTSRKQSPRKSGTFPSRSAGAVLNGLQVVVGDEVREIRTACLDGLAAIAAARRRKEQGEV